MIAHLLRITAATGALLLFTFLPFLPGRYDSLAAPLSLMSQLFGMAGLLLVPVGALWMASEQWSRLARARYPFAVTSLIVASGVWAFVSLAAMTESLSLGFGALALGVYAAVKLWRRLRPLRGATHEPSGAMPVYLVTVPIVVVLLQLALAGPATEFSRSRAIRNGASLIADIEAYRVRNGRYPPSVVSVQPDYRPSVIGIKEYRYEPSGDAYNVLFEQPTFRLGTREIVMYNPSDRQAIASHAMDVLQLTPAQLDLDRSRGHNAVHEASHPHWKYFWFD